MRAIRACSESVGAPLEKTEEAALGSGRLSGDLRVRTFLGGEGRGTASAEPARRGAGCAPGRGKDGPCGEREMRRQESWVQPVRQPALYLFCSTNSEKQANKETEQAGVEGRRAS